jgi:hypothetical protein|uniref:DUF4282 domain-containing protein n=1 Tax=Desulfobacca acetoxidans TaxID=60893 RepID=A0A7C3SJJ3_9BACT
MTPMKDFLTFRTMLTPILILMIFWLGTFICAALGLMFIIGGATAQYGGGPYLVKGLAFLVLGPLAVRIYCEILIIFFRINETLTEIKHVLEERRGTQT